MKLVKALSATLLLGAILTTSTGCSDFITAKETIPQHLAHKADDFYNVLEDKNTYATYVILDVDTAHMSDWEKSRVVRDAPGMEFFDNYNEDTILINYGYIKSSVKAFHEQREQGKNITLDIPEEAITLQGDNYATVELSKAKVSVNGNPAENDDTSKPGISFTERSNKWSIVIDSSVKTYLLPNEEDAAPITLPAQ